MKWIKRLLIILVSILLLGFATLVVIVFCYEKEVKDYIITSLNKSIKTPVIIDTKDIHLSLFRNFPMASLEFDNIKALEVSQQQKRDTLFKADNISLQFNLLDLFRKNYQVKRIDISHAYLHLKVDAKGSENYHFWENDPNNKSENFSFKLKKISLQDVSIQYTNEKIKQYHAVDLKKAKLSGNFSSDHYEMTTETDLFVQQLRKENTVYLNKKPIQLNLTFLVNKNSYTIQKGQLKMLEMLLEMSGTNVHKKEFDDMDFTLRGKNMDIQSICSLLPENAREKAKKYASRGSFYFVANIRGKYGKEHVPRITADFGISKGEIRHEEASVALTNVNLEGNYTHTGTNNGSQQHLSINNFSAQLKEGKINGKFLISDFAAPSIDLSFEADLNLTELHKFIHVDTIRAMSGELKISASYHGRIKDTEHFMEDDFQHASSTGKIELINASLLLKNNPLEFKELHGLLKMNRNDMQVETFGGKISDSEFELKGFFENILGFLTLKDQRVEVFASLNSKNLNLNQLLADKKSAASDTTYNLIISPNVECHLNCNIDQLVFRKFAASDLHGLVILENQRLLLDQVKAKVLDGNIELKGLIDASGDKKVKIACDAELTHINIQKLFTEMENFGQTSLQDKHLRGEVTASVQFSSLWSKRLKADMNSVYANADVVIDKGELIKFEPMKALSRFISLSELEHIKFSTLRTKIEIKDRNINIAKTEIKSSAINLTISGTHSFDNKIDYHFKLSLNEILARKAALAKKENEEYEVEEEGGKRNIFISMSGNINKPIIRYDRKEAKQKVKEDIKEEKHSVKQLLRDEFGWFKKDSTLTKSKKEQEKEQKKKKEGSNSFKIKFDDDKKAPDED